MALCAAAAALAVGLGTSAHAPSSAVTSPTTSHRANPATDGAKGVSAWASARVTQGVRASGSHWVYNWDTEPTFRLPAGVQFVPMVWDAAAATPDALADAAAYGPELLGFNEPDRADQADLTVEEALATWPALESTGLRLGAPGVATGAAEPDGWLGRFMAGAGERGLRVDFVPVHWYGSDFRAGPATRHLRDYLTSVHHAYGLPVWLTEYALIEFVGDVQRYPTARQQERFVTRSTRMLERLPWLERYAWFALPAPRSGSSSGLFRPDGSATAAGAAYAQAP